MSYPASEFSRRKRRNRACVDCIIVLFEIATIIAVLNHGILAVDRES